MDSILNLKPDIIIGDFKEGIISLPAWQKFQSRQGPYTSKDSATKSTGVIKVIVAGCPVDYVKTSSQAQVNAINYLAGNSEIIRDEILKEIMIAVPDMKSSYGDDFPFINSVNDFTELIGLSTIHVMSSDKDNFAYVGFEFGCDWDEEHGLGVMTHKSRVITLGQANKSFDSWPTYANNGTEIQMTEKWERENRLLKRPWWKFWN